jgi:hypothetical protein
MLVDNHNNYEHRPIITVSSPIDDQQPNSSNNSAFIAKSEDAIITDSLANDSSTFIRSFRTGLSILI